MQYHENTTHQTYVPYNTIQYHAKPGDIERGSVSTPACPTTAKLKNQVGWGRLTNTAKVSTSTSTFVQALLGEQPPSHLICDIFTPQFTQFGQKRIIINHHLSSYPIRVSSIAHICLIQIIFLTRKFLVETKCNQDLLCFLIQATAQ